MSIPGGQPRRVGELMSTGGGAFTPDGNAMLYAFQHDVYTANLDGSQSRKILTVAGFPFWLRPSPDGGLLLFSVFNSTLNTSSLWEANADGSQPRQLLVGWQKPANECCGDWTSDGKYFVFQATHEGMSNLWAIRIKGDLWHKVSHDPVRLTVGQINSQSPLPSKDGSKVYFIGSTLRDELIRYDEKTKTFTPWLSGLSAEGVTFTPDGKKIAYVSYPEGVLWASNADGSDRHELSFLPLEVSLPSWSPDGTRIEFAARQPAGFWQIFTVPAEGGDPQQLTSGDSDHTDGSWSPDGNSMVYGGTSERARQSTKNNIHMLDLKTRQVTDLPRSAGLFSPRWSPDGRYLLAITGDYQKLVLYSFANHQWQDLLKMEADYPHWTSDSKCIYFNQFTVKTLPAYRVCLADRKPQHIVDLSQGGTLVAGRFGAWTGLGPDDSILATRDIGIQEIYALDTKFPQ
jgi:Tol biopolymer transport system component